MNKRAQLQQYIRNQSTITAPGVSDGLSAKLVEQAGFKAVYASGGAIARSTGVPDIGLLSLTEVLARLREIVKATQLPVIADADTGFGNEINVARTIEEFENIGVAGLHLEDQVFPKRCGHLSGKQLIDTTDMIKKIETAVKTREDDELLLIARTDAIAVEGFDAALLRAKEYAAAGADMIFVEAPTSIEQIQQIATEIPGPKLINMFYGGKTPLVPTNTLKQWGYNLIIIPSDLQRACIRSMQNTLGVIAEHGDSETVAETLATFAEREAIIDTASFIGKF